jgi:PEP-CTERM motif
MNSILTQKSTWMLVLLCTVIGVAMTPSASATGVTCRYGSSDCLNGTDYYDWTANYGPPFSTIPNNSLARSATGLRAFVTFAGGGNGERRDQGNGWNGNFAPGDELLWTNSPGQGPLTLSFFAPLRGVGANIQAEFSGSFTALIQAFDVNGNLIDSFSEQGNSNSNGDGSAIFIGLAHDNGIRSVEFSLTSCARDCGDFAINRVDLDGCCGPSPEPATLLMLGTGMIGVAGTGYKRLRKRL